MVAIGRALMARPRLVLLDEPSMGLAPLVVDGDLRIVRALNRDEGVSFLLAEQNARLALRTPTTATSSRTAASPPAAPPAELRARTDVQEFYLGVGARGRAERTRARCRPPSNQAFEHPKDK